ncbi:MAG: helix-turn-helix transcriptional regulator [Ktedonobacteraceae bacterium]
MQETAQAKRNPREEGKAKYQEWRARLLSTPEARTRAKEIAAEQDLWLQLVETRLDAGLTQAELAERMGVSQAQVARIEKSGYDSYTLKTLRRHVQALGKNLCISIV